MLDNQLFKQIAAKLSGFYLLLVVVGLLSSQLLFVLLIGTLLLLIINLKEFHKLVIWVWQSPQKKYQSNNSSWDNIYYGVDSIVRGNRRRRRQLINSLGEFRQGADALPDGVVMYNQHNNILWCNSQARVLLGLKWPMDQGQRLDNLIRYPQFSQYLAAREYDQVILIPSPANEEILLENRIIEYGQDQYLLVSRDVTRLNQLEEMRREFVANVSHELKTPLTVLQGYLELLDDGEPLQKSTNRAVKSMRTQTTRMQSMVEQLLALSKLEFANMASKHIVVNMREQMDMLESDAISLIGQRDMTIKFDIEKGLDVYGDETQIYSACANLVTNAIRYCPDGSSVWVTWHHHPHGAQFMVRDNGQGIEPIHLNRLTERFYRIEQSRSSASGGTGLGLAIVKHVLRNHQSKLTIKSTLGKGSRFSFVIDNERIVSFINKNKH
jgi:two-component system phosphate regulon sensor histidine kinase PhoR